MADLYLDENLLEEVTARLELRKPNRAALDILARVAERHADDEEPYEAVAELATGVGKTYVMAGAIEYFAAQGVRNFAIIAPGKTILRKTLDNFTPGNRRSLLAGMEEPALITADNFADGSTRIAMSDLTKVKLYVFTVQALLGSTGTTVRRTRDYQENLGKPFYEWLRDSADLIVLADEHHVYEGKAFGKAVRELRPRLLFGFTATPSKSANVVYRYTLSQAIADKLVKIPVVVGRKDDRLDDETKLSDGALLLQWKEELLRRYCERTGRPPVNPIMLVAAPSIEDANRFQEICISPSFHGGRYADQVLVVTSKSDDHALAILDEVDRPDSPIRILINVQKLKEGWDNAQVFVLAALRASVSDVLKEQTLGRGLRLPFGEYTDVEGLNTLEVLSHDRYEQLLAKANLLKEALVDFRAQFDAAGLPQAALTPGPQIAIELAPANTSGDTPLPSVSLSSIATETGEGEAASGALVITSMEARQNDIATSLKPAKLLAPRQDVVLRVPRLRQTNVESEFHLADITPLDAFRQAGERLAVTPDEELRRTAITGRVDEGQRFVHLMATQLQDELTFNSPGKVVPLAESRNRLAQLVMTSDIVPPRADEIVALNAILDKFQAGLGDEAERVLSANLERAQREVSALIAREAAARRTNPKVDEVVEWTHFDRTIEGRGDFSDNPRDKFRPHFAYEGWSRSIYPQAWFDSSPERDVANLLDDADEIKVWLRLQKGYLGVLRRGFDSWYNPDFLAVEDAGDHWIVEVKADNEMDRPEVKEKQEVATVWAQHATAKTSTKWHYLLVSQSQVTAAKGSWPALRQMGA